MHVTKLAFHKVIAFFFAVSDPLFSPVVKLKMPEPAFFLIMSDKAMPVLSRFIWVGLLQSILFFTASAVKDFIELHRVAQAVRMKLRMKKISLLLHCLCFA